MSGTVSKTSNRLSRIRWLARIGSTARSLLYLFVGILALLFAIGNPYGRETDVTGVLRRLLDEQVFGRCLLVLLGAGLFCYALWRMFHALQDHDEYGRDWRGLQVRVGYFLSGVGYAILAGYALILSGGEGSGGGTATLSERAMGHWILLRPFGRWLLMVTGLAIIALAFAQFLRAFSGAFMRDLDFPERHRRWLVSVCGFGIAARGITFVILGVFFFNAGWKARSRELGGLHKAWETLHQQPYGNLLLGIVAVGFIAFGIFGFTEGFFRLRTPAR